MSESDKRITFHNILSTINWASRIDSTSTDKNYINTLQIHLSYQIKTHQKNLRKIHNFQLEQLSTDNERLSVHQTDDFLDEYIDIEQDNFQLEDLDTSEHSKLMSTQELDNLNDTYWENKNA